MKSFLLLFVLVVSCMSMGSNKGHRLGGDVVKNYPENSIEVLKESLARKLFQDKKFKYWEFDVRETKDGVLVVYHDREAKLDNTKPFNIDEVNYSYFKDKLINGCCKVPLFTEVLQTIYDYGPTGKIMVEIKSLISDKGREQLVQIVETYKKTGRPIAYLAFPKAFKKSFPSPGPWCKRMKIVHRARKHKKNLCK